MHLFASPLVLLFLLAADMGLASTLSLREYVKRSLNENEAVKARELEVKQAIQAVNIAQDLYKTNLKLGPQQSHLDQNFSPSGLKLYERNTEIAGVLAQTLPTGTSLAFEVTDTLDNSANVVGRIDRQYSFGLKQSLQRNFLGSLTQLEVEKSTHGLTLAQTEQKKVRFAECLRAAVEFVDGFSAQKKVEVLRELESGARDLEKMSTRDYNNHRLRKIDWLSFRADYLELNARLLAQEDIADDLASRMAIKLKSKPVEFSDPAPLFTVLPSAKWQSADNLELLGLAQELVRDESGLAIAERESRSEIELGVELGQRKGQTLVGASLEEFADNFVNLSLQWSWSALNRTADAQAQIARLEVEKTRLKQQLAQKQLEENWTEFFNGLKKNRQQLEISGKKEEIYRQQVEEAEKMYRSGKYEAEKYLDFRNRYLNEKMNNLDLTLAIWKAQIKIAELNGEHPLFCEVR